MLQTSPAVDMGPNGESRSQLACACKYNLTAEFILRFPYSYFEKFQPGAIKEFLSFSKKFLLLEIIGNDGSCLKRGS